MSDQPFLPFALPDIGEEEIAEVVETLRSGWITTGPRAKAFERQFADFIGGGVQALSCNSATAGLHLALEALGVGPGDQVLTTAYTFTATAEVVRYLGAEPVFADIDPVTLNLDPARAREAASACPRLSALLSKRTYARSFCNRTSAGVHSSQTAESAASVIDYRA